MKNWRMMAVAAMVALGSTGALRAQRVTGAVNTASYAPNSVSQGGFIAIFGTGLGPAQLAQVSAFPLPTVLQGTAARIESGGTRTDLLMVYTSAGQVGAIVPSSTPVGGGQLIVTVNGTASPGFPLTVNRSAPGIFTVNQRGTASGILQNASAPGQPVLGVRQAANPGNVLIIWGTGLGPVPGNEAAGPLPGDQPFDVLVEIGGVPARVTYKGRSGCCSGIDQVVAEVPAGVEGCFVPVLVRSNGVVSNLVTASIAPAGSTQCRDPFFSLEELERISTQGRVSVAEVSLTRTVSSLGGLGGVTLASGEERFGGQFQRFEDTSLYRALNSQAGGTCQVINAQTLLARFTPVSATGLAPGALTLTGPRGTRNIPLEQAGRFDLKLADILPSIPGLPPQGGPLFIDQGGTFTLEGTDGRRQGCSTCVGPFRVSMQVTPPLTWTNESATATIRRANGQEFTWTGGDGEGWVTITGAAGSLEDGRTASFVCAERASVGRLMVPASILTQLPATPLATFGFGYTSRGQRFTADGLDFGFFRWTDLRGRNVALQ